MTPNAEFLAAVYSGEKIERKYALARKWVVSRHCCYCKKSVEAAEAKVIGSYWCGFSRVAHPACIPEGFAEEAYECQLLDSNCNDCKHFSRAKGNCGTCLKGCRDGEFKVYPANWQGMSCFEHRKAS